MAEEVAVETFTPKFMHKWVMDRYYAGDDMSEWYILLAHNRDSGKLDESNWDCILKHIGENPSAAEEKRGLLVARFGNWAYGWHELLMVHESDTELLKRADEIRENLDDYPLFDEEDYSRRCIEEQEENVKQAVKDWVNDTDPEITDDEQEYMEYLLCRESNDDSHWPDVDEIEEVYDRVHGHLLKCSEHGTFIENDPCECQLRMVFKKQDTRPWWKRMLHIN